jgi:chemotaxis protein CheY-P-specific phosphatase CheC
MDVSRALEITSINEIKILSNVRLIYRRDLNPFYSKNNLHVQFQISGELRGAITCYLCLDDHDLEPVERNFVFPLFVEAMNILVGKQLSTGADLKDFNIKLSPPKLSMISKEINTALKSTTQYYDLELEGYCFSILTEYSIEALS